VKNIDKLDKLEKLDKLTSHKHINFIFDKYAEKIFKSFFFNSLKICFLGVITSGIFFITISSIGRTDAKSLVIIGLSLIFTLIITYISGRFATIPRKIRPAISNFCFFAPSLCLAAKAEVFSPVVWGFTLAFAVCFNWPIYSKLKNTKTLSYSEKLKAKTDKLIDPNYQQDR